MKVRTFCFSIYMQGINNQILLNSSKIRFSPRAKARGAMFFFNVSNLLSFLIQSKKIIHSGSHLLNSSIHQLHSFAYKDNVSGRPCNIIILSVKNILFDAQR